MAKKPNDADTLFKRLTNLFKSGALVKRKIKDFKTPSASTALDLFRKTQRHAYSNVINAYGQYDRMSRYCLAGDTVILTSHGPLSIKELTDASGSGKQFDIFAYDAATKSIVSVPVRRAWLTKKDVIWEIEFDSGDIVRCTGDHPFMLDDALYCEAKYLLSKHVLSFDAKTLMLQSNHVVSVRITSSEEDVYDLMVDNLHNFALGTKTGQVIGFVHNSDFSEMEYCLGAETLIAVPKGYKTIKELADEYGLDKEFIVYSYDHNKRQIVPALAKQARKTRTDMSFKVTFDSGKTIIGTGNHRLMLRDGSYKKIEELMPGDSMMPFYRKSLWDTKQDTGDGYRHIYAMDYERSTLKNGWIAEHKLIAEWAANRQMLKGEVVHHKNFVKYDNRPENLQIMHHSDHERYHAEILNGKKWAPENQEWIEKFKIQHSNWMTENNPAQRRDITFGKILEKCEQIGFNLYHVSDAFNTDPNVIKRHLRKNGFKIYGIYQRGSQ